ncbi:hypothetical protein E4U41_002932 [Claviceps citrina]|nr:hypothetical protein E4U41_002932 [Claviceps citrina]
MRAEKLFPPNQHNISCDQHKRGLTLPRTLVSKRSHIKLAGAGTPPGGLCGSSHLNRIFEM